MKPLRRAVLWGTFGFLVILALACARPVTSDPAAEQAAIRQTDEAWIKAIGAKQLDATVGYYDDNASLFAPNAPIATGREAIRKMWKDMFAMPGFSLVPKTEKIEVARSGDLAYSQGTYEFTVNTSEGTPVTDRGKFVMVWKKQADGSWKGVADIFNTDLPPGPAPK